MSEYTVSEHRSVAITHGQPLADNNSSSVTGHLTQEVENQFVAGNHMNNNAAKGLRSI